VEKLKQKRVKKTSRNSSLPPSKGFKPNQSNAQTTPVDGKETGSHRNGGRELSQQPDQVVVAQAKRCPHCGIEVDPSTQRLSGIYERIELPPVTPHVTRVERYGGMCPCCQKGYEAPVPVGLEPGSPFGSNIASLVTYLRYSHAISYERLSQLMSELYGLRLSEGAIANLLCTFSRKMARLSNSWHGIIKREILLEQGLHYFCHIITHQVPLSNLWRKLLHNYSDS